MSHFFLIEEEHLPKIEELFKHKSHGEYVVLHSSGRFSDIVQYDEKFQDVRVITVPSVKLDAKRELR